MYKDAEKLYDRIIETFGFKTTYQVKTKYHFIWENADTYPDIDLPYDTGYPRGIFTTFEDYVELHE